MEKSRTILIFPSDCIIMENKAGKLKISKKIIYNSLCLCFARAEGAKDENKDGGHA